MTRSNLSPLTLSLLCPLLALACDVEDIADAAGDELTERSAGEPTSRVTGPGNTWSASTPYVSYYVDLLCDPNNGCSSPPEFETMLLDFSSNDELSIQGKTDGDGGLPNGTAYEKLANGQWTVVEAPYVVHLNEPYMNGGVEVTDTAFRIKYHHSGNPWGLVGSHWETSSRWVWFPRANGDSFAPNYTLKFTLQSCGDGVVQGDEECDDGDLQNGDGCEDTCTETVSGGKIFLTQGGTNIYQFNIGTNTFTPNPITVPPGSATSYATITNDGRYVYRILDANDTSNPNDVGHPIDRLDTTTNTWQQNWMDGPPTQVPCSYSRRDHFAWVGDGFYLVDNYCVNPNTTSFAKVWRKNDGDVDWTLVTTFVGNTTGHGTWDLDSDKLYSYSRNAGGYGWSKYDVFDTSGDAFLSTHMDWTFEHGSFQYGRAFSRGGFYAHARDQANNWTMWSEKLDSSDSPILQETKSTGKAFNPGDDAAWGVDPATGIIYVFANFYMNNMPPGLRSYNPETNVMTNSIPLPGGGGTLSGANLTVLRPLAE